MKVWGTKASTRIFGLLFFSSETSLNGVSAGLERTLSGM